MNVENARGLSDEHATEADSDELASQGEADETETEESEQSDESEDESESSDEDESNDDEETESDDEDSESEESSDDDETDGAKAKPKKGIHKRIHKLVGKLTAKEQRILELENEMAALKTGKGGSNSDNSLVVPKEDDFDSVEAFDEAMFAYRLKKVAADEAAAAKAKDEAVKQAEAKKKLEKRIAEFKKTNEDYDDVIKSTADFDIPPWLNYEIFHSDLGPELAYELAQDPDTLEKLEELAKSNQGAAVRLLGKFETKIEAKKAAADAKKTAIKSTNKKPIAPVSSKGKGVARSIHEAKNFSEYEKIRREQLKNKGL